MGVSEFRLELTRFRGSSELCVMRGIGSATQGHEHTPFQIECSMRLALEAVSPCDAELCRQNGFTQISEEPLSWTLDDLRTSDSTEVSRCNAQVLPIPRSSKRKRFA